MSRSGRKNPFVVSNYYPDQDGVLRPDKPGCCPRSRSHGRTCEIVFDHWRSRASGPEFALAVYYCCTHDCAFTVYPLGWVPYARHPLVPLTPDGQSVQGGSPDDFWRESVFWAMADAARGEKWPEEIRTGPVSEDVVRFEDDKVPAKPEKAPGCARTQKRHLGKALRLLALSSGSTKRGRERTAAKLGIDLNLLTEGRRLLGKRSRDGPLWQRRGREGMKVLQRLEPRDHTCRKLMDLGARVFWGKPLPH